MPRKSFRLPMLFCAFVALAAVPARADEVFVSGYTDGCFGNGCVPPDTSALETATRFGLTYTNSQFSGTTAGGFFGIGSVSGGRFVQGVNNLGTFYLLASLNTYTGQRFTLRVTFTAPQEFTGSNGATFTAALTGAVLSDTAGGVMLDFDNTPILFTFKDTNCGATTLGGGQQTTCGSGSFFFSLNDVAINPNDVVPLTGQITGAQQTAIPEPATLLLLGTGLVGALAADRRRRVAGAA